MIRPPWPLSSPRPPSLAAIASGAPPPPALVGRAAEAHGHAAWAAAGFDGRGVTIAVIDVGFDGLDALPAGARPRAVRPVAGLRLPAEGAPGQAHGAAVVEVLGRLSPGVEVWTAPVADELDLLEALAAITALQPDLVVASLGFDNIWAADGTSPVARAVDALVHETGAVWVAAAGNEGGRYRRGLVTDHDHDGLLEIDGEEGLSLRAREGELAARLRWGGPPPADLRIELRDLWGGACAAAVQPAHTAAVVDVISGCEGDQVRLELWSTLGAGGRLVVYGPGGLAAADPSHELTVPADASRALAVGVCTPQDAQDAQGAPDEEVAAAAAPSRWVAAPYSSRGPTEDGRLRPQLCGVDGFASTSLGGVFRGTSAAAPVIASLLALQLDARRRADAAAALRGAAVDAGPPGADTGSGAGRAQLGAPPCGCGGGAPAGLWGLAGLGAVVRRSGRQRSPAAPRQAHS
ncbi:MAG: S8 family serine peptidase [Deltaproteobacteria bacterium]|nr:S8 family serine peptidase [Deltaproteobacteria bacterium]